MHGVVGKDWPFSTDIESKGSKTQKYNKLINDGWILLRILAYFLTDWLLKYNTHRAAVLVIQEQTSDA